MVSTAPDAPTAGAFDSPEAPAEVSAEPSATGPEAGSPDAAEGAYQSAAGTPVRTGTFDVTLAPEASGIVAGRANSEVLWIVDDGPPTTPLVAVDRAGTTLGRVTLSGVEGTDIEDIAIGPCVAPSTTCLYVGDIGDNAALRPSISVHRFPEPDPSAGSVDVVTAVYTYPEGPRNAEAMLVDDRGRPIIIAKTADVAEIYRGQPNGGVLEPLGTFTIPIPEQPFRTLFMDLTVTAADSAPDGSRVLRRTYDSLLELTMTPGGGGLDTLATWPATEVPAAQEPQGEAVGYLPDGSSYVTVSESTGDIWVTTR